MRASTGVAAGRWAAIGACGGDSGRAVDSPDRFGPPWLTEGEFEIGEGSSFSNDGSLVGTVAYPPRELSFRGFPLSVQALLHDESFLARPRIPAEAMLGVGGDPPIEHLPVFRVSTEGDDWTMDAIARLDVRNRDMFIRPEGTPFEERGIQLRALVPPSR